MSNDPIADMQRRIEESARRLFDRGPLTAELYDENEPDGAVVLKDKNGVIVIAMPRAAWDKFRAMKGERPDSP